MREELVVSWLSKFLSHKYIPFIYGFVYVKPTIRFHMRTQSRLNPSLFISQQPLTKLINIDTVGPLPADENGNIYYVHCIYDKSVKRGQRYATEKVKHQLSYDKDALPYPVMS